MQIDIANHIEKLLFLHDTLNIPGFGGFAASRTPAAVDYAGGAVTPPAKALAFSEDLAVDDGILTDDISKAHGISTEEAREAIRQFVEQMQAQLAQREIVSLPGIGRLYKNYVQKIQFLPDATNFNAGSYGLPPLQFSPISRSRDVVEKTAEVGTATNGSTSVATAVPAPAAESAKQPTGVPPIPPLPAPPNFVSEPYSAPRSSATRFGTGIGLGLIICTALFGLWWWQYKKDQNNIRSAPEMTDEPGLNTTPLAVVPDIVKRGSDKDKPTQSKPAPVEREDQDLDDEVEQAAAARAVEVQRRQNETPAASKPTGRLCVLIIATLSDQNNVERLIAKLEGAGYEVYHRQQRGHQVGISFYYTTPAEIDEKKAELIRFTGEKGVFVKTK